MKPTNSSDARISFDFTVQIVEGGSEGAFRLRTPAVQGKPGERFVYLCIGAYAGQTGARACWRAKISLEGITRTLLNAALSMRSSVLEARCAGTAPDGGPSRASVRLLGSGWSIV